MFVIRISLKFYVGTAKSKEQKHALTATNLMETAVAVGARLKQDGAAKSTVRWRRRATAAGSKSTETVTAGME